MSDASDGNILSAWLQSAKSMGLPSGGGAEATDEFFQGNVNQYRHDREGVIGEMMAELERGNVIAIERDGGMLLMDPSRFALEQSPAIALVSNMSDVEMARVSLLDFDDAERSFGIDPFAESGQDGTDDTASPLAAVREVRSLLLPFLDIDMMDIATELLTNMLILVAYTPGATLMDIPTFICHGVTQDLGLSFVPYDQDESLLSCLLMRSSPSSFARTMRHGAGILTERMERFMRGQVLRHVLGQSRPKSIRQRLDERGIVVMRIPNGAWVPSLCQEFLLRTSGIGDGTSIRWTSMTTNEVFSSNPFAGTDVMGLVGQLDRQTQEHGMTKSRDVINHQVSQRTDLLANGDRIGLLRFCEGL